MTVYVDPRKGSDANDGRALTSAFKTFQKAVEAAQSGDTILLVPGAYDQDLPQRVSAARAGGATIAVVGADG
jgi:hypothetical protein